MKLVHRRKIIRLESIGIFPRLSQRGKNPLFESSLSVVLGNVRFDTHAAARLSRLLEIPLVMGPPEFPQLDYQAPTPILPIARSPLANLALDHLPE